jgi:DUF971 family protein
MTENTQNALRAIRIVVRKEAQTLTIEWGDGHTTVFPLDGLRRACPCAGCMGGHENMGRLPEREIFLVPALMRWENVTLQPVGRYALRIIWDDGHDSGIYSWDRLRAMCPCDQCATG